MLDTLKTAIQSNDTATIRAAADDLEALSERVNSMAATVGNRVQLAEHTQARLREHNLALQKKTSRLVDANLVESISDFTLAEQGVQVSLSSQAKIQ